MGLETDAPVAIEAVGLERAYGRIRAVDGVSLHVRTGEIVALLGPNGAGKSTLLGLIGGTLRADRGTVRYPLARPGAAADESIAFVRELPVVYENLTVREHLEFVARGRSLAEPERALGEALAQTGLVAQSGQAAGTLSKGGRQRLCLAGALLARTPVVLLDEPSTGLDPAAQEQLVVTIRGLAASGAAVVVCTHALPIAHGAASRIVLYARGRIVEEVVRAEVGSLEDLRVRYLRATAAQPDLAGSA